MWSSYCLHKECRGSGFYSIPDSWFLFFVCLFLKEQAGEFICASVYPFVKRELVTNLKTLFFVHFQSKTQHHFGNVKRNFHSFLKIATYDVQNIPIFYQPNHQVNNNTGKGMFCFIFLWGCMLPLAMTFK